MVDDSVPLDDVEGYEALASIVLDLGVDGRLVGVEILGDEEGPGSSGTGHRGGTARGAAQPFLNPSLREPSAGHFESDDPPKWSPPEVRS
jgi:hypothetical protein